MTTKNIRYPVRLHCFLLLLLFWTTACRQDAPKEQSVSGTIAPGKPVSAAPATRHTDPDEKNVLYPGQSLWAGGFGLVLDGDQTGLGARLTENGEFILYNTSGRLWAAKTKGKAPGFELIMQDDGNLVLYDSSFEPVWASGTHAFLGGNKYKTTEWKPVKLVLEPNLLVLYSATGRRVWNNAVGEITTPE